jgi:tetratricopeptide (TPR) repeat protein
MNEPSKNVPKKSRAVRLLFGFACLITIIFLFYAEEDLRGYLEWNSYKKQLEAQGEKLDWQAVIPAPVPDDQNFALAPIVATSYGNLLTPDGKLIPVNKRDPNYVNRLSMSLTDNADDPPKNGIGNWQVATTSDLAAWKNYYRALAAKTNEFPVPALPQSPAADVLFALGKYDSAIEELRQAAQLPDSRFPTDYATDDPAEILLPYLASLKRCSQVLQLRALAELQNNQSDKASEDVKLMLRLADSVHNEPFIITHLVRFVMVQFALQPIYEGLANHQWSDAQLAEMDSELASLDFLADYKHSINGERAANVRIIGWIGRNQGQLQTFMGDMGNGKQNTQSIEFYVAVLHLMPRGWFYQNDINLAKLDGLWLKGAVDDEQQTVSPGALTSPENKVIHAIRYHGPYNFLTAILAPQLGTFAKRAAYAQNAVNLARVAIALERYRLANGGYPASLDALSPHYLPEVPHDVIGGQPLHYRATQDGLFVLYSIGWNERDDGGMVAFRGHSSGAVNIDGGDWVWRYPKK